MRAFHFNPSRSLRIWRRDVSCYNCSYAEANRDKILFATVDRQTAFQRFFFDFAGFRFVFALDRFSGVSNDKSKTGPRRVVGREGLDTSLLSFFRILACLFLGIGN
jgi:hypothetical protein